MNENVNKTKRVSANSRKLLILMNQIPVFKLKIEHIQAKQLILLDNIKYLEFKSEINDIEFTISKKSAKKILLGTTEKFRLMIT